ncbi:MAG: hypothetical protein GY883_08715 [Shimia sp.]|nr:hypothetical protein [Shimia sp.]
MKHVPASALLPNSRFARLFELIRQENLIADKSEETAADQRDFIADHLLKNATASLQTAA